jgi:hypothetical protein
MTATGFLARLRGQDVLLFGWVAIGWPLVALVFGGGELGLSTVFDEGEPLRGLVWLLAVVGAFVVIGTRNVEDAPDPRPLDERLSLYGPLFGGVLLVAGGATSGLGLEDGPGFGLAFLAMFVLLMLAGFERVGRLPRMTRVALVTPFILIASGIFAGTMADIGLGPDLLRDALDSTAGAVGLGEIVASLGVSLGLFLLIAAVFYPMLVIAPRTLVDGRVDGLSWLVRFVVFIVGSLLGLAWLGALGG